MPDIEIPGYHIEELIRRGGTATSWKAVQLSLKRPVVLKTLHNDGSAEDKAKLDAVLSQMRKVASLKDIGVVEVIDAGLHDGIYYVVTGLADGRSAAERLGPAPTPFLEREILLIAADVAGALRYAWREKHLFHANIKPDNILIRADGSAMVSDMGMVIKETYCDETTGQTHEVIGGTPNYMSPEQIQGAGDLDFRTDIYSLGATLYHFATGSMPFSGAPAEQAMEGHLNEHIANPRSVNPSISIGLAYLIARMMVKDRDQRYQTWDEVLSDIKRVKASPVFIQKGEPFGHSTVEPLAVQTEGAMRLSRRRRRQPMSNVEFTLTLVKWAVVVALWIVFACHLLRQPAE